MEHLQTFPSVSERLHGGAEAGVFLSHDITAALAIHLGLCDAPPIQNLHATSLVQNLAKHLRANKCTDQ